MKPIEMERLKDKGCVPAKFQCHVVLQRIDPVLKLFMDKTDSNILPKSSLCSTDLPEEHDQNTDENCNTIQRCEKKASVLQATDKDMLKGKRRMENFPLERIETHFEQIPSKIAAFDLSLERSNFDVTISPTHNMFIAHETENDVNHEEAHSGNSSPQSTPIKDNPYDNILFHRNIIVDHQKKMQFKHPQLYFDSDARSFAERFVKHEAIICNVCGRIFANEEKLKEHHMYVLQKKIQHPQDAFHFIQMISTPIRNVVPITSPLVELLRSRPFLWNIAEYGKPDSVPLHASSIGYRINGNEIQNFNRNGQCPTQLIKIEKQDDGYPDIDINSKTKKILGTVKVDSDTCLRQSSTSSIECMLCLLCFKTTKDALVHIGRFHCFQSPYMYCNDCGVVLMNEESYNKHNSNFHTQKSQEDLRIHPCHLCPQEFKIKEDYSRHLKDSHSDPFSCPECPRTFLSFESLAHHRGLHKDSFQFYPCPVCGHLVTNNLGDHILHAHAEFVPSENEFENQMHLWAEIQSKTDIIKCDLCDFELRTGGDCKKKREFSNHRFSGQCKGVEINEKNSQWMCKPCGMKMSSLYDFRLHMAINHSDRYFSSEGCIAKKAIWWPVKEERKECVVCLAKPADMFNHVKQIHGEDVLEYALKSTKIEKDQQMCHLCKRSVKNLWQHTKEVHGEKKFSCQLCDKHFAFPSRLKVHMNKAHGVEHQGQKCSQCAKIFSTKLGLKQHLESVHKNVNSSDTYKQSGHVHKCYRCAKVFKSKADLDQHTDFAHGNVTKGKKQKSKVRGFRKQEASKENVSRSGKDGYRCSVCFKRFNDGNEMLEHKVSHDSKPFSCPFEGCDKVFSYKRGLNLHVSQKHFEGKACVCQWCPATYPNAKELKNHVQKKHKSYFGEFLMQDRKDFQA